MDYGNEEEVERTNLRPKLDTPLFSLPPQVQYCVMTVACCVFYTCRLSQIVKCTMAGIPKVSCCMLCCITNNALLTIIYRVHGAAMQLTILHAIFKSMNLI